MRRSYCVTNATAACGQSSSIAVPNIVINCSFVLIKKPSEISNVDGTWIGGEHVGDSRTISIITAIVLIVGLVLLAQCVHRHRHSRLIPSSMNGWLRVEAHSIKLCLRPLFLRR